MHGTPPTHVVRTRTALPVRPKPPLMSRHYASMGLDVGMRACVLPTGKSPPLTPLSKIPLSPIGCLLSRLTAYGSAMNNKLMLTIVVLYHGIKIYLPVVI